jgi:hypothetical protein
MGERWLKEQGRNGLPSDRSYGKKPRKLESIVSIDRLLLSGNDNDIKKMKEVKKEFHQAISNMKIVDTHEHLCSPFLPEINFEMDLPYHLTHEYLQGDLISSGMPEPFFASKKFEYLKKPCSEDQSEQRWKELKPYLENVRNTIYYRYLLIALRDLYEFNGEEIDDTNWKKVSSAIREKSRNHLEWSLEVLDKMKIYRVILDINYPPNLNEIAQINEKIFKDERLVQVARFDDFNQGNLKVIEKFTKWKIHSFDDYLNALDLAFEAFVKAGARGVKSGLAYERTLFFDNVSKSDAERSFSKGRKNISPQERKIFEDFIMYAICERCAEYNLPFQIHTGIQAGNYNTIENANPIHLTNLFQEFPDVCFDIFHGGYPYTREAGILAKYFPNVYLDACWLAHISPAAYKRGLDEWLEIVPSNKIFAWGGDQEIIEHSYASLVLAKNLISEVLASKVVSGYFSKKGAISVAEKIMGRNAIEVYKF